MKILAAALWLFTLLPGAGYCVEPSEILEPVEDCFLKALGVDVRTLSLSTQELRRFGDNGDFDTGMYYTFDIHSPESPFNGMQAAVLRLYSGPIRAPRDAIDKGSRPGLYSITILADDNLHLNGSQASITYNVVRKKLWTSVFRSAPGPSGHDVMEMVGTDLASNARFPADTTPSYENGAFLNPTEEAETRRSSTIVFAGAKTIERHEKALDCRAGI